MAGKSAEGCMASVCESELGMCHVDVHVVPRALAAEYEE